MEINKLTIIACSGSILAATLFGTTSQGMPLQSIKIGEVQSVNLAVWNGNQANISQPKEEAQSLSSVSYQRQPQQAACIKLSCGCFNCVNAN